MPLSRQPRHAEPHRIAGELREKNNMTQYFQSVAAENAGKPTAFQAVGRGFKSHLPLHLFNNLGAVELRAIYSLCGAVGLVLAGELREAAGWFSHV